VFVAYQGVANRHGIERGSEELLEVSTEHFARGHCAPADVQPDSQQPQRGRLGVPSRGGLIQTENENENNENEKVIKGLL
jgi:hypothetical protein